MRERIESLEGSDFAIHTGADGTRVEVRLALRPPEPAVPPAVQADTPPAIQPAAPLQGALLHDLEPACAARR